MIFATAFLTFVRVIQAVEKTYTIAGCLLRVQWTDGVIRIVNDYGLQRLLMEQTEQRTAMLVDRLEADYRQYYQRPLQIGADSLAVEIWAHVYTERFFARLYRHFPWAPMRRLYHFIRRRCRIIDCGETRRDSNRWLWDLLGKRKRWMYLLFRKKLQFAQ